MYCLIVNRSSIRPAGSISFEAFRYRQLPETVPYSCTLLFPCLDSLFCCNVFGWNSRIESDRQVEASHSPEEWVRPNNRHCLVFQDIILAQIIILIFLAVRASPSYRWYFFGTSLTFCLQYPLSTCSPECLSAGCHVRTDSLRIH